MTNTLLKLIFLMLPLQAFCLDRFLEPVKFADQQEFFIKGGMGVLSQKMDSVLFYSTTDLDCRKANFYFVISNDSDAYVNFMTSDVRVTDQYGRPVRIIPMEEHMERLRSQANLKSFLNVALGGLQLFCAHDAGRVDYNRHVHRDLIGREGRHRYSRHEDCFEHGSYYSRALQRAAEREALLETTFRGRAIHDELAMKACRYENFYLSSNTIPPHEVYSANFQIDVPKFMLPDLEYLYFTFNVGGEKHQFCMYTGHCKGKHRHIY